MKAQAVEEHPEEHQEHQGALSNTGREYQTYQLKRLIMAIKFTEVFIRNLQPSEKPYTVREGNGFTMRVRPSGTKSWIFTYDYLEQRRNMTLGQYPTVTLKAAREAHAVAQRLLAQGIDPAQQRTVETKAKKVQQQVEAAEPTISLLATEYMERYAKPRKRSWATDEKRLKKYVIPAWGNRKAKDITRRDINLLLDKAAQQGRTGVGANRVLALVRRMFNFAIERGLLENNPAFLVKAPVKEIRRDRVLSPAEIRLFWEQLDAAPMSQPFRLALQFQLATGQRIGEILGAEWTEVDLTAQLWTIPASKTKNGRLHTVPLNATALTILTDLKALDLPGRWLFPSMRSKGERPSNTESIDQAVKRCEFHEVAPFRTHDLRRTVATMLGELNINRTVLGKVLNHADSTVTAIYDRHTYDKEKRLALDAWDRRFKEILTIGTVTSNVVELKQA